MNNKTAKGIALAAALALPVAAQAQDDKTPHTHTQ